MSETDHTSALVNAALGLIAERGWLGLSLAEAAQRAGIAPADARACLPDRGALLARFVELADAAALDGALVDGPMRDRLFDIVMRRIDFLQARRLGVIALLRDLPGDPASALSLACASRRAMAAMLDAIGIETSGLRGQLRIHGMGLLWLATLHAWKNDDSDDLSATMAALDKAITRAGQAERSLSDLCGGAFRARRGAENPAAATSDEG
jgi:ubiquinone biosynthesis protein COQ9